MMELVLQNPAASAPLVIDVSLVCNTPEAQVLANVLENSQAVERPWVKLEQAHNRVAVLCGSGPSIKDFVWAVRNLQISGADVFALNGAAKFLHSNDLLANAQIIMDAQPKTCELVGPAQAHYFASQVDPALFCGVPDAILWHSTHGDILPDEQLDFPKQARDYCLIGAGYSVGCTALGLLFALGYRSVKVFGLDSSNEAGASHVAHQKMNDGEPMTIRHFRDKEYTCSLTMSTQADTFLRRGRAFEAEGMKIDVFGRGLLPDMWNNPLSEREKYDLMWQQPAYREVAPGELVVEDFLSLTLEKGLVIDFGCGTGRGGLKIAEAGFDVVLVDFCPNSRDEATKHLPFRQLDLTQKMYFEQKGKYGFCTDVLEHIPPAHVDQVINNIMSCCEYAFFQISLVDDAMGGLIGQPLHLSVHPFQWWLDTFSHLGYDVLLKRDQGDTALFFVSQE